ncbi:MAG: hypothetical protein HKN76_19165, partial [Saprospiraceae bacterium]|nr:hypothetical protein [Saprospiraceae bacterium]
MKNSLLKILFAVYSFYAFQINAQDSVFVHAQFDQESLKIRWSFSGLEAMQMAFDRTWQLKIYEDEESMLVHEINVRPKENAEILRFITSASDSVTYEIYNDLIGGNLLLESPDQEAWFELGFYFGLFDNFELSKALGLGHEINGLDKTRPYRIEINLQDANPARFRVAKKKVIYQDPVIRPKPDLLSLECNDNVVTVTGLLNESAQYYSSFDLERTVQGIDSFKQINRRPLIVNYAYEGSLISQRDTISGEGTTRYRLIGKDFWGDYGPYSDIASIDPCHITYVPPYPVLIKETEEPESMVISWLIPDSLHNLLAGFNIYRSSEKFGRQEKQNSVILPATQFTFIDRNPLSVAYYQVEAIYEKNKVKRSLSVHAALLDTKAPAKPANLQAHLDTNSRVVTLKWDEVKDNDLKGYRVFFAHGPESARLLLNNLETTNPFIHDTLSKNHLHQKIYYWVTSRDFSQNESFYSDSVIVTIPDIIPPAAPHLTHIVSDEHYLDVYYDRSASTGVIMHLLQKRRRGDLDWTSI